MGLKPLQSTRTSAIWRKKFIDYEDEWLFYHRQWFRKVEGQLLGKNDEIRSSPLDHYRNSHTLLRIKTTTKINIKMVKFTKSGHSVPNLIFWMPKLKRCDGVLTCCCHGTLLMQPGVLGYRTESYHLPSPPCPLLPWWCHGCSQTVMPASPSYLNPENLGRKTNFKRKSQTNRPLH